jgi:1,4-dihydroxy-2-naphthoate octaprenyltransferase
MAPSSPQPTSLQIWILASRPKTLPAAASPVIVASAAAFYEGGFRLLPAVAALLAALLLQIGANLANDVFDYYKGADSYGRLGPLRVTSAGLLTPRQVLLGMAAVFGLAALLGIYLILEGGWPILIIGALSIVSAIAYTGGPAPLGYLGLGDVFVFLFFGLAAVCGTYYVQAGALTPLAVWSAVPMGFLTTNILVVNNLRDLETDQAAGKRTLAVRFGAAWTRREYLVLLIGAYLAPSVMVLLNIGPAWLMASWASLAWAPGLVHRIYHQQGKALNQALADTGLLELVYSLAYALGLVIAALG